MCEYCEKDEPIIDTMNELSLKGDFYYGVTVCISDNELCVTASPDTHECGFQEETVPINFCPMCGRRL